MEEKIQWHTPFRGAVKLELSPYQDILEYMDEKALTKKPLQVDLLVIKKEENKKIDHPIGHIFRMWNILEYKSPTDYVSIDDFYKVSAYASLVKSGAKKEDEIKFQEITITFVCSKIPKNLFEHLEQVRKYKKIQSGQEKGIYYFQKGGEFPIQFLLLSELNPSYKWLVGLTDHITKEVFYSIVTDYEEEEKNEYKEVILDVIVKANYEFIKQLKEEGTMSKAMLELFRPELEQAKREAEKMGIQKGIQKGIQQGIQQGIQEGKQEGIQEGILNLLVQMYKDKVDYNYIIKVAKKQGISEDRLKAVIQKDAELQ